MLDQGGVLSPKLKSRMNDRVFREMLKSASIGNEWTCPKCAYVGFVEGDLPAWINCPAECKNVKYFTSCNEVWHRGQTCEETQKVRAVAQDPKLRAQEAMSEATKRSCPHCNQEFLKSDGCNRIRCKCNELSCYLCGEKVQDYSHFCNCNNGLPDVASACSCGKACRLFTSTDAMEKIDRDRRTEAGRKVLADAGVDDEKDIESVLGSPATKKTATATKVNPPPQPNAAPRVGARPNRGVHIGAGQNVWELVRRVRDQRARAWYVLQERLEAVRVGRQGDRQRKKAEDQTYPNEARTKAEEDRRSHMEGPDRALYWRRRELYWMGRELYWEGRDDYWESREEYWDGREERAREMYNDQVQINNNGQGDCTIC